MFVPNFTKIEWDPDFFVVDLVWNDPRMLLLLLPPLLLHLLKHIYPIHQSVDIRYCPSMTTTAFSDSNLIPSVAQFCLRLLYKCYYCCMYIIAPAKKRKIIATLGNIIAATQM